MNPYDPCPINTSSPKLRRYNAIGEYSPRIEIQLFNDVIHEFKKKSICYQKKYINNAYLMYNNSIHILNHINNFDNDDIFVLYCPSCIKKIGI